MTFRNVIGDKPIRLGETMGKRDEIIGELRNMGLAMCGDMEQRAEQFNAGYQEAMQHQTGGAEHRAWLVQVAQDIIHQWVETAYQTTLCGEAELHPGAERMRHLYLAEPWLPACKIADALLSEIDFEHPDN